MHLRAAAKTLPLIATALAAGALACGCGSAGAGAVLDPVANAAETTNNADGARVAMQIAVTVSGVPQQITIDSNGHMQFKGQEGELAMQLNGVPGAAAGGLGEGGTITERFAGGKMFMSSEAFAGKLPAGASWLELDLAAAEKKLGLDPSALSSGQSNPAQFLEYLRASGGTALVTGTERVRGVETTRYSGTIDLAEDPGRRLTGGEAGDRRDRLAHRREHDPRAGVGGLQEPDPQVLAGDAAEPRRTADRNQDQRGILRLRPPAGRAGPGGLRNVSSCRPAGSARSAPAPERRAHAPSGHVRRAGGFRLVWVRATVQALPAEEQRPERELGRG